MQINLIIKRYWFDEIKAGRKNKEYRDATERLLKQICTKGESGFFDGFKPITKILLLNGYNKNRPTMLIECVGIEIEDGNQTIVFNLGKLLKVENC